MSKRGLSTIVTTLIIILVAIVAIGIIWYVMSNILTGSSEEISLGKFTVDMQIKNVNVDETANNISLNVKRNPGKGDLTGIKFIFNDGTNSQTFEVTNIVLNELGELFFSFIIVNPPFLAADVLTISIAPIFTSESGNNLFGNVVSIYNVKTGTTCSPSCASPSTVACGTPIIDANACGSCPSGTQCSVGDTCVGGSCVTTPTISYVSRGFSSPTVSPGGPLTVTLTVDIISTGDTYYALEEAIPNDWIVTDDGGGVTSNSSRLAWIVISGAADTTYTYALTAPASAGSYGFGGVYQFETGTLTETQGSTTVTVA